jgi:DNA-binding LacI/PurR family transcriptional regulator
VAQRAGVSLATASRVINGGDQVRHETRERVERAMRELLYIPPGRPGVSGAIGLFVPDLANPIFPLLAAAMEKHATSVGLSTILCNTTGSPTRETEYVHMLLERQVAGMIFISSELGDLRADHSHYRRLLAAGARLVFVNGANDDLAVAAVGVDERAAGHLATQHLIDLGHRRIAFVAGPDHYLPTLLKAAGRENALRAAGIDPAGLVEHSNFSVDGGRSSARSLLARDNPPTGVICSNDLMAIGVMQEAEKVGLHIPDDVSVVGFDGIPAATWTKPALTTIEQPVEKIAETAITVLRTLIADPERELPQFLFRPTLQVRGSTAAARS